MNKKVTHILSLTIFLLSAIGFSIYNTHFSTAEQEENNETEVYSKELASLSINDTSDLLIDANSEMNKITSINAELTALENEVEILNESAKTSYYHDKFIGKKTASGEVYNNKKYTAAHKNLPFGSKLRVTNNENDESVIVTVNDRGPHTKGRQLDLSKQAFLDITHNKNAGVLNVKIEVLPEGYQDSKLDLQESLDEFIL